MELIFEWDPKKAAYNRRKHRVTFEEAKSIFGDPYELMISDADHSEEEQRSVSIGESDKGRSLLTVYTQVENVIRSSALVRRKATRLQNIDRDAVTNDA